MLQSPIRRKYLAYPKDFTQSRVQVKQSKIKYSFNQDYQIDASRLKKYDSIIDLANDINKNQHQIGSLSDQKMYKKDATIEEEQPLKEHEHSKLPQIKQWLLKRPRFAVHEQEEIPQSGELNLEGSCSPGTIKKQFENRQVPLQKEDPCKIELLMKEQGQSTKIRDKNMIRFSSTGEIQPKKWLTSERQLIHSFREAAIKTKDQEPIRANELPIVNRSIQNKSYAKEQFERAKQRQQSFCEGFGKVNPNLLGIINTNQPQQNKSHPEFEPTLISKLKLEINALSEKKKAINHLQVEHEIGDSNNDMNHNQNASRLTNLKNNPEKQLDGNRSNKDGNKHSKSNKSKGMVVSYRSSLSMLKQIETKFRAEQHKADKLNVVIKIPKIFTEDIIYKHQDKAELHEVATRIFEELRIPSSNILIKRYSNCTQLINKNICLIWHFEGKRYLGGWQSEYLDEGFKHGLGLQWEPSQYVYYGEFVKNKKQGLGVYKDRHDHLSIGYFQNGKRVQDSEPEQSEEEIEEGQWRRGSAYAQFEHESAYDSEYCQN